MSESLEDRARELAGRIGMRFNLAQGDWGPQIDYTRDNLLDFACAASQEGREEERKRIKRYIEQQIRDWSYDGDVDDVLCALLNLGMPLFGEPWAEDMERVSELLRGEAEDG